MGSRFRIFISYRRNDTRGYAGWLEDCLEREYGTGSVFLDVGDIGAGADFPKVIERTIRQSDVVLCLIGDEWSAKGDDEGLPRIHDPEDWVRKEVATAIRSRRTLIPILIEDAAMPTPRDLPEELGELSRRNALRMTLASWKDDLKKLSEFLEQMRSQKEASKIAGQEILDRARTGENPPAWIGRVHGLEGKVFREDLETGRWQKQAYEVQFGGMPRSNNWFSTQEFVEAVESKMLKKSPEPTAKQKLMSSGPIQDLYDKLRDAVLGLGSNIVEYPSRLYIGFKSRKTFLSVVPQQTQLKLYLKLSSSPEDPHRVLRDVRSIGHWGVGDYEAVLVDETQLPPVLELIRQAYESQH